jgi:hypothetical protein
MNNEIEKTRMAIRVLVILLIVLNEKLLDENLKKFHTILYDEIEVLEKNSI